MEALRFDFNGSLDEFKRVSQACLRVNASPASWNLQRSTKSSTRLYVVSIVFVVMFFTSCGERFEQSLLAQQKCVGDGANLYVQCFDGRQKVVLLGYGAFYVMQEGGVPMASTFCGEKPEQIAITMRNVDYLLKVENIRDVQKPFRILFPRRARKLAVTRAYTMNALPFRNF